MMVPVVFTMIVHRSVCIDSGRGRSAMCVCSGSCLSHAHAFLSLNAVWLDVACF